MAAMQGDASRPVGRSGGARWVGVVGVGPLWYPAIWKGIDDEQKEKAESGAPTRGEKGAATVASEVADGHFIELYHNGPHT